MWLIPNGKGGIAPYPPHVMFYAPYLTDADLGSNGALGLDGNPAGPAFVAGAGTPQALIICPWDGPRAQALQQMHAQAANNDPSRRL